jgi:hypothetical protein
MPQLLLGVESYLELGVWSQFCISLEISKGGKGTQAMVPDIGSLVPHTVITRSYTTIASSGVRLHKMRALHATK